MTILLSFAAAIVDIESFLTVYHLFVAHMTGTSVHFGRMLATGEWKGGARAGTVIFGFMFGSIAGRMVIEAGVRRSFRAVASFTLSAEALLILAAMWIRLGIYSSVRPEELSPAASCLLLGLLATAMGLQNATLSRVGPLTVHTTFVTGMLNKLAQLGSKWIFWIYDEWRRTSNFWDVLLHAYRHDVFREARFIGGIWLFYVFGSAAGTAMDAVWRTRTLYVPVALLALAVVVDQFLPMSIEEEKEQE